VICAIQWVEHGGSCNFLPARMCRKDSPFLLSCHLKPRSSFPWLAPCPSYASWWPAALLHFSRFLQIARGTATSVYTPWNFRWMHCWPNHTLRWWRSHRLPLLSTLPCPEKHDIINKWGGKWMNRKHKDKEWGKVEIEGCGMWSEDWGLRGTGFLYSPEPDHRSCHPSLRGTISFIFN
jgi:hypothetical protein